MYKLFKSVEQVFLLLLQRQPTCNLSKFPSKLPFNIFFPPESEIFNYMCCLPTAGRFKAEEGLGKMKNNLELSSAKSAKLR